MSGSAENCPCPAGRRFCKQAWCPPSLAGVSAGQRGAHATCAVCPHAPHWLRCCLRAKWLLLTCVYVLGVSMCKVFLRCRDACSAWRDDFRRLAEVRCRKVIRSDLARLFCTDLLHFRRCCLRARWSLHTRVHALDVFFRALGVFLCKVFLRCRDACSAWRDDFRRLAEVRCRTVTRPGLARQFSLPSCAPAVTVSVVYPSLLQPRWFT